MKYITIVALFATLAVAAPISRASTPTPAPVSGSKLGSHLKTTNGMPPPVTPALLKRSDNEEATEQLAVSQTAKGISKLRLMVL